jgi:sugar (pentulose or hexulose) kinase
MKRDIIIGIDAGTSVIKSVAFSASGEQLAVAALPNKYTTSNDGAAEQDMALTWSDVAETLQGLVGHRARRWSVDDRQRRRTCRPRVDLARQSRWINS